MTDSFDDDFDKDSEEENINLTNNENKEEEINDSNKKQSDLAFEAFIDKKYDDIINSNLKKEDNDKILKKKKIMIL